MNQMSPDELFVIASRVALVGWVLLVVGLLGPACWAPRLLFFGGRVVPLMLCAGYAVALIRGWGTAPGGNFSTLAGVATLFASKPVLLAGWIHFLAFDLWVGRWEVDQTVAAGSPALLKALTVPCLFATLMFGPAGLLIYFVAARLTRTKTA
jgi:Domain of unknown function (DUF4281)